MQEHLEWIYEFLGYPAADIKALLRAAATTASPVLGAQRRVCAVPLLCAPRTSRLPQLLPRSADGRISILLTYVQELSLRSGINFPQGVDCVAVYAELHK